MIRKFSVGWRPGLIGDVAAAHGRYYAEAWGFGAVFEAKVAGEMAAFIQRYDPARDAVFVADDGPEFLGALTIDGSDPALAAGQAHLRWFIMTEAARGKGVGGALMERAMGFLTGTGYSACYLTTFAGLDAARRLYEKHGFSITSEGEDVTWGTPVLEQRFDWRAG